MAIKLQHSNTWSTYFVSFTCVKWMNLFDITNSYDLVYKWFHALKSEHNADVVAYVIMPNHLHIIIHFQKDGFDLNTIIANGKRFMAYEIINRLEKNNSNLLLEKLTSLTSEREWKKGQLHKVFKGTFDAKAIITHHFLLQKINYIHNNPVSGKWMLAKDFVEYEHSSALFYEIKLERHFRSVLYLNK